MAGKPIIKILNGVRGKERLEKEVRSSAIKHGIMIDDKKYDIVVAIGGDGTMIKAALLGKPIITVKGGRRNLLIDVPQEKIDEMFDRLIKKDYEKCDYGLLEMKVGGKRFLAFNEIGIVSVIPQPIDIEIGYLKRKIESEADGVLVSTPQGSTGWSFSSNGTYLDSNAGSFMISLLNPIMSALRNVIVPQLPIKIAAGTRGHNDRAVLVSDGKIIAKLNHRDTVVVSKSKEVATIYRFFDQDIDKAIFKKSYGVVR